MITSEPANQPNIILILTDQHRLSAVGAYGDTPCQTPNIDFLASSAIHFENAYTTSPICTPARASVQTGLYPHTHGLTGNSFDLSSAMHSLEDRPNLLSRQLQKAGYNLGYIGKWHLGTDATHTKFGTQNVQCLPSDIGYHGQDISGYGNMGLDYEPYRAYLLENNWQHAVKPWAHDTPRLRNAGELQGPRESTVAHYITSATIDLIDKFSQQKKPFFIQHNFWGPHEPHYACSDFIDLYRNIKIPAWDNYHFPSREASSLLQMKVHPLHDQVGWEAWENVLRYYYASASQIDAEVGRIIHFLQNKQLIENTIIIFAADHGETLGSHGGLVDKGWHHFEETHRIPLMMSKPSIKPQVRDQFVSLVDLYPTLLDLAGVEGSKIPVQPQGKSLLPLLDDNDSSWRDSIVIEFHGGHNHGITQRTMRFENIKYGYSGGHPEELYDLNTDPYEMKNIIDEPAYHETVKMMRGKLLDWMNQTADPALQFYERQMNYWHGTPDQTI